MSELVLTVTIGTGQPLDEDVKRAIIGVIGQGATDVARDLGHGDVFLMVTEHEAVRP